MQSNREKGFSLVELVVGLSVALLIVGGIVPLVGSALKTQANSSAKMKDMQSGRIAMDHISEELKYALANSVGADNGTTSDSGIYFNRTINANGKLGTRHIYFQAGTGNKGGTVVIDEGPNPNTTIPWTVDRRTTYAVDAVRSLKFTISAPAATSIIDPDFNSAGAANNINAKRKTITVQLVVNSVPTNTAQANNLSDPRRTELTTEVTTENNNI